MHGCTSAPAYVRVCVCVHMNTHTLTLVARRSPLTASYSSFSLPFYWLSRPQQADASLIDTGPLPPSPPLPAQSRVRTSACVRSGGVRGQNGSLGEGFACMWSALGKLMTTSGSRCLLYSYVSTSTLIFATVYVMKQKQFQPSSRGGVDSLSFKDAKRIASQLRLVEWQGLNLT